MAQVSYRSFSFNSFSKLQSGLHSRKFTENKTRFCLIFQCIHNALQRVELYRWQMCDVCCLLKEILSELTQLYRKIRTCHLSLIFTSFTHTHTHTQTHTQTHFKEVSNNHFTLLILFSFNIATTFPCVLTCSFLQFSNYASRESRGKRV